MKYRAEIDGLRAIAVVPVILFHASVQPFSGGYIGVDIFFVISGYLITSILLSELEREEFSLLRFYERRARRILPALFFVMAASLPLAWLWLLPSDMKDFSRSLVAVPLFSSNFLFWLEDDYWSPESELKPLLHTWSLGVEEQFYILFPLFLVWAWKKGGKFTLLAIVLIGLASLLASQWMAHHYPKANFFLLPSRAWELALGACLAYYLAHQRSGTPVSGRLKTLPDLLGITGLLLIGFAVFAFDDATPFPGLLALVPTLGVALIILFASQRTLVGRLLGSRYLVGIGLISYSLYLWHQPLFAFARHAGLGEDSQAILLGIAALCFPLAYLSWRYVENPFRNRRKFSRRTIFTAAVLISALFVAIGVAGIATGGLKERTAARNLMLESIEEKLKPNRGLDDRCDGDLSLSPLCRTSEEPEILVWGDSFAKHLVEGILASNPQAKLIQMTKSSCGPFFDIAPVLLPRRSVEWAEDCLQFSARVRELLKNRPSIRYAVLSSPFKQYLKRRARLLYRDGTLRKSTPEQVEQALRRTLAELSEMGVEPVIFTPTPGTGKNIGRCLAKAQRQGVALDRCDFGEDKIVGEIKSVYGLLEKLQPEYRVVRLDRLICREGRCRSHLGPVYLYRDKWHLSREGSAELGRRFDFHGLIEGKPAP